jgi:hypothetical protein
LDRASLAFSSGLQLSKLWLMPKVLCHFPTAVCQVRSGIALPLAASELTRRSPPFQRGLADACEGTLTISSARQLRNADHVSLPFAVDGQLGRDGDQLDDQRCSLAGWCRDTGRIFAGVGCRLTTCSSSQVSPIALDAVVRYPSCCPLNCALFDRLAPPFAGLEVLLALRRHGHHQRRPDLPLLPG